jgi:hypothetical protein
MINYVLFWGGGLVSFTQHELFWRFIHFVFISIVSVFIALQGYTTIRSSSADGRVGGFHILAITNKVLWIFIYKSLYEHRLSLTGKNGSGYNEVDYMIHYVNF